jgi:signal transduction histidine kinase
MGNCFAELTEALIRQKGFSPLPEPLVLSPRIIASSRLPNPGETARDIDGLLVRTQGEIVQIGEPVNEQRSILYSSEGKTYTAFLQEHKEVAAFVLDLPQKQPVELTGILVFHRTADQHEQYPQAWTLLLRDTTDIRILPGGPWLTRKREIALQALMGLFLLFSIVIIIWLRVRINRQKQRQHDMDILLSERKRIASDLHDTLQQNLAGISLQVQTALKATETAPGKVAGFLQMTRQALDEAHTMLRTSVWQLHATTAPDKSLEQSIQELAHRLPEHTLTCRLDALPKELPDACSAQLLAVIKESITNIVKHAKATEIVITATAIPDGIQVTIDDNGKGFETPASPSSEKGHYGLTGMKERMRKLDGLFLIESEPEHGTRVLLTFPYTKKRRPRD